MTSSLASTSAVSSASHCQFNAETFLDMLERPSTSLAQPVDVVQETKDLSRDLEVIIILSEDPTVPLDHLFVFVTLLRSLYLFIPHLWNRPVLMKYLLVLELNTFHRFLVILLTHLFFHHSFQHHNHRLHLHIHYRPHLYIGIGPTPHLPSESLHYYGKLVGLMGIIGPAGIAMPRSRQCF